VLQIPTQIYKKQSCPVGLRFNSTGADVLPKPVGGSMPNKAFASSSAARDEGQGSSHHQPLGLGKQMKSAEAPSSLGEQKLGGLRRQVKLAKRDS